MSAVKSGSSLRSLVLTPQRTPAFVIPSRSPLPFPSPQLARSSPDRTRLLSDQDDGLEASPPDGAPASPRPLLCLPRIRTPHRRAVESDTDLTTRAAMSLPHVGKVTTPYGFRAVLAASPCTRRRESLFHRNKPVTVTVTEADQQDPGPGPGPGPSPSRSWVSLRPIRALGLQVMKELQALSPAPRRPCPVMSRDQKS